MPYTQKNVIVGAAALFINDTAAAAVPAGTGGTSLASTLEGTAGWRNVGLTTDGLSLAYEPTYTDVEVDQLLDSAMIFKSQMRVTLSTSLSEATLDNLLVSWGQATSTLASSTSDSTLGIASGALGDAPVERSLIAVGASPRSFAQKRERVYYARRVLSVESSTHVLRRAEATVFPVNFRLLPDTSAPAGQEYGYVRDRQV